MKKTNTIVRMQRDGKQARRRPDDTEEFVSVMPVAPMSEADIEAAAVSVEMAAIISAGGLWMGVEPAYEILDQG